MVGLCGFYIFWGFFVLGSVKDVGVVSLMSGEVVVMVLFYKGDGIFLNDFLDIVNMVFNDEEL